MTYDEGRYVRRVASASILAGAALGAFLLAAWAAGRQIDLSPEPWRLRPSIADQETAR